MTRSALSVRRVEQALDRLHTRARGTLALHYFAAMNRILLAVGFVPTALVKIRGERFTSISTSNPIGAFFEAMYQTGGYWQFIGWAQLAGGLLLLVPRTATLGAILFFPIILNIFVITVALEFTGTPVIAGGMLLANAFLICWDWHRLKPILFPRAAQLAVEEPITPPRTTGTARLEVGGYVAVTAGMMGALLWTRGSFPGALVLPCLVLALLGGMALLASFALRLRRRPATA